MSTEKIATFDEAQRQIAAKRIEARLSALSARAGIVVINCVWNLHQGINSCGLHRLDVHVEGGRSLRMYFTDQELATFWGMEETPALDERLRILAARLPTLLGMPETATPIVQK